jgi:outer membrane protein
LLALAGLGLWARAIAGQAPGTLPVVTLQEARRLAAAVDPVSVAARGGVGAAAWERRAAWLDVVTPNLTAATADTRFSEPFFNLGTGGISAGATSATLDARYTVGPAKFAALRRADASLAHAEANETAAAFRTALATDVAYYAVLADRELERVAAERLRRATEQLDVARVRVLAGDAIESDSLQLLLETNRARLAVLRRDSALTVSRLTLGRRVGATSPVDAAPVDSAKPPPLPISLDAAVGEMRASGPELIAARAAERRAGAALTAARGSYLPEIVVAASTGAYDDRFFPSGLTRSQVTVSVSWPLWDGGQREAQVARTGAELETVRAEREDGERAAGERMAAAYNGYETARAGIELARVGVTVAAETYRVQSARYREGATTILDLLEAQVNLSEAQVTLIEANYAARLALAQIEALLGRRME